MHHGMSVRCICLCHGLLLMLQWQRIGTGGIPWRFLMFLSINFDEVDF
jgi:hypothetical protein